MDRIQENMCFCNLLSIRWWNIQTCLCTTGWYIEHYVSQIIISPPSVPYIQNTTAGVNAAESHLEVYFRTRLVSETHSNVAEALALVLKYWVLILLFPFV